MRTIPKTHLFTSSSTSNQPETTSKPVTGCKIAVTKSIDSTEGEGKEEKSRTLFLPNNWRQEVCKCDDCLKLYEAENLSFLIEEEDTVHFYESQAKAEGNNHHQIISSSPFQTEKEKRAKLSCSRKREMNLLIEFAKNVKCQVSSSLGVCTDFLIDFRVEFNFEISHDD